MNRLERIKEGLNHQPCCDHRGADEHGCWDCRNTGCAHPQYVDRIVDPELYGDMVALATVVDALEKMHAPYRTHDLLSNPDHGYDVCWRCPDETGEPHLWPCPTAAEILKLREEIK